MKELAEKLKELNARKSDVQNEITVGARSKKTPRKEVVLWLEDVRKINNDKEELEKEVANVKFLSRTRLRKRVFDKIGEVKEKVERRFPDGLMIDAIPSRGEMLPTTTLVGDSTSKKVEHIWKSLISVDVLKIGVYAMGGSGKTTIMKHIHNRVFERKDKFDNVHWKTVSKDVNVIKLQDCIASALKIKDFDKIKEEVGRAAKLSTKLKEEKRCVLIFDDVWDAFNLEDVGIPEPTIENGCKIILTTRSYNVCRRMNCKPIKMELLSKDEAWNLLLEKVGRDVSLTSDLENIAKQVAKACGCLPLAIVTIGTSMKGVVDKHEWKYALTKLRECTKGIKEMSKVIEQLKFSYTRLNDVKAQHCLLYCALYPEDYKIKRHELIAYLVAEKIVEEWKVGKMGLTRGTQY